MLHVAVILWWSENIRLAEVSMTGARGHSHPSILVTRWGNYRPIITIRGKRILAMRVVEKSTTLLAESLQLQENRFFVHRESSVFVRNPNTSRHRHNYYPLITDHVSAVEK